MSIFDRLLRFRKWLPLPLPDKRFHIVRWIFIEADRLAVIGTLLSFVFVTLMVVGTTWTFEMQSLLFETPAVQTILATLLSGIILLVSVVVSINSIVLSHDIASVQSQENRVQGVSEFRRNLSYLTESGESPVDPSSFLEVMAEAISNRGVKLLDASHEYQSDDELEAKIEELVDMLENKIEHLTEPTPATTAAEFGTLWRGLNFDYGFFVDRIHSIRREYDETLSEEVQDEFDELVYTFELFAIGKEYFKTLYYSREVSELSLTLLIVSLPVILINATTILAINAGLFPDIWLLGLPPFQTFVSFTLTVSLAPYLVLTSYIFRLASVARQTATSGPFSLRD